MMYISVIIAGFGGGMVRGLVGFLKHQFAYKKVEFNLPYFLLNTFISGVIGLLISAAIFETGDEFLKIAFVTPAISFIVGYAGGDFCEGIYKIIIKKANG